MAKLSVQQIKTLARDIIREYPGGIRYSALLNEVLRRHPETPSNTIQGSIWNLDVLFPREIWKPSRGLFKAVAVDQKEEAAPAEPAEPAIQGLSEADFYESFGGWLKSELGEVTEVFALGGSGLRAKWGTPDVVGVYKARARDIVKFPSEIVAGEVKIDPQASIVAFGQAAAYRLFASKTYIAMPSSMPQADLDRLESLSILFGIGLALFELNRDHPNYEIRVRAQRFSPDMFYVNEFADRLREHNSTTFEALFG